MANIASDEQQIDKLIQDLNKASTYQVRHLFRFIAAARLSKPASELTQEEVAAQWDVFKQMDSRWFKHYRDVKISRKELGEEALHHARNYWRLRDVVEGSKDYDRQTRQAFDRELECAKAFFEKDKADLQAMFEGTKAAAAKEVQRLMEENARSNSQIEALGAQNMQLEKEAVKNAGVMQAQAREIARLEGQIRGLRVAAAGDGEGYDAGDECSDAENDGSIVSMDNGSVEDDDWAVVSVE